MTFSKVRNAGGAKQPCPRADKVKLVELVEVLTHKGKQLNRKSKSRRQYVNLPQAAKGAAARPNQGRLIRLRARVKWASGRKGSLSGQQVYWYVKENKKNRDESKLSGTQCCGFDSPGSKVKRKQVTTDAQGWTPIVEFYLSEYGGDEFSIGATEDSGYKGGQSSAVYTVWRTMYYEITEMRKSGGGAKYRMPSATINKIRASYKAVFVRMVNVGSRNTGDYQENFETHEKGYQWADKYCGKKGVPWKVHYSVVDHLVPKARKESRSFKYFASAKSSSTHRISPYYFDGFPWLIAAHYRVAGGTWKELPKGAVTRVKRKGRTRLRVDFKGTGVDPKRLFPNKVEVHIRYWHAPGYNGWGGANLHLVICRGSMDEAYGTAGIATAMAGTGIHEPGHALGLVYPPLAWKSATHGNHCKHKGCVMWYQGYTGRPLDFHSSRDPSCHTYLRGKDMSKAKMEAKWKFPR